jgi:AcrR family transcriptional regulator
MPVLVWAPLKGLSMQEIVSQREMSGRMRAADRSAMLVLEADRQINLRRSARISPADIAGSLGTSRSLVYSYFPDSSSLLVAVLDRHARLLMDAGIEAVAFHADFAQSMVAYSRIYLDHVVAHGAAIDLCFRDKWVTRNLGGEMRPLAKRIYLRLARQAKRDLLYASRDALGVVQILQAIPEEAAHLVRCGEISQDTAHQLNRRLITASIDALRPALS